VETIGIRAPLQVAVACSYHFSAPALSINAPAKIRKIQPGTVRSEVATGRSAGSNDDRSGISVRPIKGIRPVLRESIRCVVQGIVKILSTISSSFYNNQA